MDENKDLSLEEVAKLVEKKSDVLPIESVQNIISDTDKKILVSCDFPYSLSLRIKDFESEKDFIKFIKSVERMVRSSYEFKLWRNYINDVMKISKCAVTFESSSDVTIEIHHHIPSLFNLVKAVILTEMSKDNEFCTFDIARRVIEIHYENRLGYIPLSSTIHEKFHNRKIELPISIVCGDYHWCITNLVLDDAIKEEIEHRLSIQTWTTPPKWWLGSYPGLISREGGESTE